ncbi:hypothetical protein Btru_032335 [Bulinus truncatus]|nr:hypothetical protein Btru_032335 [Bulinus truncatus]
MDSWKNSENWSCDKLVEELEKENKLSRAILDGFREKNIDGKKFRYLTPQGLKESIGVMDISPIDMIIIYEKQAQATKPILFRIYNDPVYGLIEIHPVCQAIIDTSEFQRLRYIKQLGMGYFVFPGASHNRFEHSLGTCHLAGKFVRLLRKNQPYLGITDVDVLCVEIAGLCIGLEESKAVSKSPHEQIQSTSSSIFDSITKNNATVKNLLLQYGLIETDITFIKEMMNGDFFNDDGKETPKGRGKHKAFLYERFESVEIFRVNQACDKAREYLKDSKEYPQDKVLEILYAEKKDEDITGDLKDAHNLIKRIFERDMYSTAFESEPIKDNNGISTSNLEIAQFDIGLKDVPNIHFYVFEKHNSNKAKLLEEDKKDKMLGTYKNLERVVRVLSYDRDKNKKKEIFDFTKKVLSKDCYGVKPKTEITTDYPSRPINDLNTWTSDTCEEFLKKNKMSEENIKRLKGYGLLESGSRFSRLTVDVVLNIKEVYHLAGELARSLQLNQPELQINDQDILCVEIAGLCHDLGHEAYSYGLFYYSGQDENHNNLKNKIVCNQRNGIDVNKWDYLARDCHHTGFQNSFNIQRFMMFARVLEADGELQICIKMKDGKHKPAKEICTRIFNRKLYSCAFESESIDSKSIEKKLVEKDIIEEIKKENDKQNFDIEVKVYNFDFGMKEENPVTRLKTYEKPTSTDAEVVSEEEISSVFVPKIFNEKIIRIYNKGEKEQNDDIRKAAKIWFNRWKEDNARLLNEEENYDVMSLPTSDCQEDWMANIEIAKKENDEISYTFQHNCAGKLSRETIKNLIYQISEEKNLNRDHDVGSGELDNLTSTSINDPEQLELAQAIVNMLRKKNRSDPLLVSCVDSTEESQKLTPKGIEEAIIIIAKGRLRLDPIFIKVHIIDLKVKTENNVTTITMCDKILPTGGNNVQEIHGVFDSKIIQVYNNGDKSQDKILKESSRLWLARSKAKKVINVSELRTKILTRSSSRATNVSCGSFWVSNASGDSSRVTNVSDDSSRVTNGSEIEHFYEGDSYESKWKNCKKLGHEKFFRLDEEEELKSYIEQNHKEIEDLRELIRLMGKLTVIIKVKQNNNSATGTGFIQKITNYDKELLLLTVTTVNHVIKDYTLVSDIQLEMRSERHETLFEAKGFKVSKSEQEDGDKDWCAVEFKIKSTDEVNKLELKQTLNRLAEIQQKLYNDYKDKKNEIVIIVGHPHGGPKCVSFGKVFKEPETLGVMRSSQRWCRYKYTAMTCPGSSGSPIFILGQPICGFGYWFGHPHNHSRYLKYDESTKQNISESSVGVDHIF